MAKIYYDGDADLGLLAGKTVAVIGYGSQGHAPALNLKDNGVDVVVGLPAGSRSRAKAQKDGLAVKTAAEAAVAADVITVAAALLFFLFLPLLTGIPMPTSLWQFRFPGGGGLWTWFPSWI